MNNDAETLFRLTQEEIRGKIARYYRDEPGTTWGELINHNTRDIIFASPRGWATSIHITQQQDDTFNVYSNDKGLHDITKFRRERPLEAEAIDLYCCLPFRMKEEGFSMICTHDMLKHLAPLFVLFVQKIHAAQKLRYLEGINC